MGNFRNYSSILLLILQIQILLSNPIYPINPSGEYFISVGDWGGATLNGDFDTTAKNVGTAIMTFVENHETMFVLNSGNSFYSCWKNSSGFQIITDYNYIINELDIYWINALGEHDYGYNPDSLTDMSDIIPQWVMEARYFHTRYMSNSGFPINIIILDTNPCVSEYLFDEQTSWDPCELVFSSCDLKDKVCHFHDNIISQNCTKQYIWFQKKLRSIPRNEWIIVVGHHPIDEINGIEDFKTLIDGPYVDLYINGHIHGFEHYKTSNVNSGYRNANNKYVTNGAASMLKLSDNIDKYYYDEELGIHFYLSTPEYPWNNDANGETNKIGGRKIIWREKTPGFTAHYITEQSLTTYFIDIYGNVLYNFNVSNY
jgi:hypothetical protein